MALGLIIGVQQARANNSDEGGGGDVTVVPFEANSGDACGTADGQFSWLGDQRVFIGGTLTDRATGCGDMETTITFTVYVAPYGDTTVYTERADNVTKEYGWREDPKGDPDSTPSIDRILVNVCRKPIGGGSGAYCGATRTYRPPT